MNNKTGGPASEATLRDLFAAKAMQGMVTGTDEWLEDAVAKEAYKMADAMLVEREK